jgi:hypothetical protein
MISMNREESGVQPVNLERYLIESWEHVIDKLKLITADLTLEVELKSSHPFLDRGIEKEKLSPTTLLECIPEGYLIDSSLFLFSFSLCFPQKKNAPHS